MSCSLGLGTGTNPGPLAAGGGSQGRRPQSGPQGWEAQSCQQHSSGFLGRAADGPGPAAPSGPTTCVQGRAVLEGGFAGFHSATRPFSAPLSRTFCGLTPSSSSHEPLSVTHNPYLFSSGPTPESIFISLPRRALTPSFRGQFFSLNRLCGGWQVKPNRNKQGKTRVLIERRSPAPGEITTFL